MHVLLETAERKLLYLCFLTLVESKRSKEQAMPLERQTLSTASLRALCTAPGQGAAGSNSEAFSSCSESRALGSRLLARIKETGTGGLAL